MGCLNLACAVRDPDCAALDVRVLDCATLKIMSCLFMGFVDPLGAVRELGCAASDECCSFTELCDRCVLFIHGVLRPLTCAVRALGCTTLNLFHTFCGVCCLLTG